LRLARQIFFSGKVQGIGFRARTHKIAEAHQVFGFVKNLEDGRVELWIEGEEEDLDHFEHTVEQSMRNFIADIDSSEVDPKDFEVFEIQK